MEGLTLKYVVLNKTNNWVERKTNKVYISIHWKTLPSHGNFPRNDDKTDGSSTL